MRSREEGFALPELLLAMVAGTIVLLMVGQMMVISIGQSSNITGRTQATQQGRLALFQIMERLHSACIAPQTVPVKSGLGSTGTSMTIVNSRGSSVTPVPVLLKYELVPPTGGTLFERTYPMTGGTAPNWTFATTATKNTVLLKNVKPTPGLPVFRYYKYVNGAISTTPLSAPAGTGLSAVDAASTVQVTVAFDSYPLTEAKDIRDAASVSSSALLRFTPPSYATAGVNPPCQ